MQNKKAGSACTHVASTVLLTSHPANEIKRKFLYSKKANIFGLTKEVGYTV